MNSDISTFIKSADELSNNLNSVLESDTSDISNEDYNKISSKVQSLQYLLKSIKTKKKITEVVMNVDKSLDKKPKHVSSSNFCYECKAKISNKHRHVKYHSMCTFCGNINMFKRNAKSNQLNKTAIVTGGRVKIGYETSLSLLRNKATVITTTRFVDDCYERYSAEKDFDKFKDRLHIYQLNMLDESNISKFIQYIKQNFPRIDYLINNAAQTIRRPKQFYQHVIDKYDNYKNIKQIIYRDDKEMLLTVNGDVNRHLCIENNETKNNDNTMMTNEDLMKSIFPPDELDEFGQQLDLRHNNSWMLNLENVDIKELVEVFIINAIAPFILCKHLKDVMGYKSDNDNKNMSWIINVTSMEGIFNWKRKSTRHPHTNMAKAALNMMTRTVGLNYIEDGIVVVGVDTGWNNSQQPDSYDVTTPVDCKDGSARILDPIYRRLENHSVIYKNYKIIEF
jgi:NAD(P)-dependent dehydrogenase (short-subunit alcohol dehydrogenase family)